MPKQKKPAPQKTSIPTATLKITINAFNPIGSVYPINASLTLTSGDPSIFSLTGDSLLITLPSQQPVQLIYQLPDPRYVLLGLAFTNPKGGVGRTQFPSIIVNRDAASSQMVVNDAAVEKCNGIDFTYVILVQDALTGAIGLIDPDVETDIDN